MLLAAASRSHELSERLQLAPRLGIGLAALGRPGYINLGHQEDLESTERSVEGMRDLTHAVLDEAYSLGIRYFDCARSYGLSEEFAGSWLALHPEATDVVVGSKWGYEYTAAWRVKVGGGEAHEVKKHTVEQLEQQLKETHERLPWLDLYQIHSATQESGVLRSHEVLKVLSTLREGGCSVGLSVSNPQVPTIVEAINIREGERPLFSSVQATFNLLDQSAAPALREAAEAGMLVIVKEALANGRLTARAPSSAGLVLLQQEADALDTTVDALALAWVMSHPWVGMCLSGAATVEQLRSNADSLRLVPLEPELHSRLSESLAQRPDEYWQDRKSLSWN
ncbi:hypothetical protein AB1Y20_005219 [Prymnesium parvum]|uniref:NADP-dependent oxidoreductase domain-containing protein n=1 Tax=Prymnesium parvum TaxID=97485 RepID=A0AB34J3N7_PRYPA